MPCCCPPDFAPARIEALTAEQWAEFDPHVQAEVALFQQALRGAGKLLTEVARRGLDTRWVQARRDFEEAKIWANGRVADVMSAAMERTLTAMHPTPEQWAIVREVLPAELRRLGGEPAGD